MGTRKNDRSVSYSQVDRTYVNAVCLSFFLIGLSLSLSPFFFSGEGRKGGCYCCCCLPTYLASNFASFSSVGRQDGVTSQLFTRPPVVKETAWIPFEGGWMLLRFAALRHKTIDRSFGLCVCWALGLEFTNPHGLSDIIRMSAAAELLTSLSLVRVRYHQLACSLVSVIRPSSRSKIMRLLWK